MILDYCFYSGGAKGADSYWEECMKNREAVTMTVYRPYHVKNLKKEEKEKVERQYSEVVGELERRYIADDSYTGLLMRRDMLQVKDCDAVFAIGRLAENGYADGGTGYSTTRAILDGKPVYLFSQTESKWMKWDKESERFKECEPPVLTHKACLVGSRDLRENGRKAIDRIIERTFAK